ncbi:MAG TPA: metal-sulfur cluster assembly factor [Balneolales bacterium]|nr:metal-sulfur cluster assembly factor [Balneolales bacterium]
MEAEGKINRKLIADRLKLVLDPEVGLNIIDLGLVYDIEYSKTTVKVTVSMTTMGCPMTRYIRMSIENVLLKIPGIKQPEVEIIWSPAWSPEMINPGVMARR